MKRMSDNGGYSRELPRTTERNKSPMQTTEIANMTGMTFMGEGCPAACPGTKKEIKLARQEANAAAAERKVRGNASLPHKNRAAPPSFRRNSPIAFLVSHSSTSDGESQYFAAELSEFYWEKS